ncbi:hypothetical protein HZB78_06125 [Candidatus Collierbacteria bacterium]|nr:hypothetical protein [Candidatus Collierbacteria bacterium]
MKNIVSADQLFEVIDVFGKRIRTSKQYWEKIKTEKHQELKYGVREVGQALQKPDSAFRSVKDETIALYRKQMDGDILIVVAKHLNGSGFVVTVYQTKKVIDKGEKLWPK